MTSIANSAEVFANSADRSVVIRWHGPLTSATCDDLQRRIDAAVVEGLRHFRLDLDENAEIDDSGVRCVRDTAGRCADLGISFAMQPEWPLRM